MGEDQAFTAFVAEQIEQRQVEGHDDLLSHLMAPDETGARLAKDDIIATSILILNAGHEATVHALGNGVKSLLQMNMRPEPAEETAEEILRFDPPLHMFMRFVYEDMIFGGVPLKRGQQIGLSLGAATRDPDRFENPNRFNPNRADAGHVSFGAGAHFCLGAALARLEMQVALPVLFNRLPKLRLAAQPRYADRYHFHGLEQLEVAWT